MSVDKLTSVWLVTWEWVGDDKAATPKVAAMFSGRKGSDYVKQAVEAIYISHHNSKFDLFYYAKNPKNYPFKAEYGFVGPSRWMGEIMCGHNPFLHARKVRNIKITYNTDDETSMTWDEIPRPQWSII